MRDPEIAPLVSVVTPAYNEEEGIRPLFSALDEAFKAAGAPWEWVVVDDHSGDGTLRAVEGLARERGRVHGHRLSRNSGSHAAILCGLKECSGACAIVVSADMRYGPETFREMLSKWKEGAQIVFGVTEERHDETLAGSLSSRAFYFVMRTLAGLKALPAGGIDFFLLDRKVVDALGQFKELNTNVVTLLLWMGFRQESVRAAKLPRVHGGSKWTFGRKLTVFADVVVSSSFFPIRAMSYLGLLTVLAGLAALAWAFAASAQARAYLAILGPLLLIGGTQFVFLGVLGEYLWRTLDEARGRPRHLVERSVHPPEAAGGARP